MLIVFLGTSATVPTKYRFPPSIAFVRGKEILLFDVGEGTQIRMMQSRLSPLKIKKIFITHLHGDHIFGLPGLLQSMALNKRRDKVEIYGPKGIFGFIKMFEEATPYRREFEIHVYELDGVGVICDNKDYKIVAVPSCHNTEGYAYIFQEHDKPGKLNVEKLLKLGVPPGPLYKKLKMGESINVSGKVIRPEDVLGPPVKGVKITYTGDTKPCPEIYEAAIDSDVLIHDSTFGENEKDLAEVAGHSTAKEAANAALKTRSHLLVLFHISARYVDPTPLFREASQIYPFVLIPHDLQVIRI